VPVLAVQDARASDGPWRRRIDHGHTPGSHPMHRELTCRPSLLGGRAGRPETVGTTHVL